MSDTSSDTSRRAVLGAVAVAPVTIAGMALAQPSNAGFGPLPGAGRVDVVVNNAGIRNVAPFAQMTDTAFDRMIATNVKGSFNVLREAARRTRDGGRIISLSSSIIHMNPAGAAAYAATKAAQEIYSSSLAKELAGRNISVNAAAPGAVDTQLLRQHGEEALRGIPAQTPLGRLGQPEDIANVIAFLCSKDGGWINGQNIFANGGIA